MTRLRLTLGVLALTGLMPALPLQAASLPNYGDVSVFVPFVNAAAMGDPAQYVSPQIQVGFNAPNAASPAFSVTMDTGSVGIFVGSNYFTPPASGRNDPSFVGSGGETLTSSGFIIQGDWYRTEVNLFNGTTLVATATVPVLAVTNVSCTANARSCHVTDSSGADTHYFGVGFSGGSGQPQGTPDKNAFLNVTSVPGNASLPSPGYILTTQGAQIGLTSSNAQGFALMKLEPLLAPNATQWQSPAANADLLTDWQHPRGTITVNGKSGQGAVLFDTGVTTGFLTPPVGVSPNTGTGPAGAECNGSTPPGCAVSGTSVRVTFPQTSSPIASLNYTVGAGNGAQTGNPVSPFAVSIEHNGAPFLNTTVRFLQAFAYMYDAGNGFTGLKASGRTPAQYATTKTGSMSVESTFQCFFDWAGPSLGLRGKRYLPTSYSWPYTYRFDPRRQTALAVSSGSAASGNVSATKANEIYVLGPGGQVTDQGPLSGWLTAAGCQ
jgi:hypothetical protein